MPRFDQYGEFFKNYDPENTQPSAQQVIKRLKKRKSNKNRYIKLAIFLTPYLLGVVAVITAISLTISFFIKNGQSVNGTYMNMASDQASQVVVEEHEEIILFNPTTTDSTISLGSKIDSEHAILVDCSTGNILAQKSANTKIYPASMTKVMATLVAAENIKNLDATFTMTSEIIDPLYREGSTLAGFMPNEEVTLRDMFYGAILESGGEAIVGLAMYISGSEAEFVKLMNQKAVELGLKSTNFCNVSGLHDVNHYTTCKEMAIIMQAALSNDFCRQVLSTEYYTVPANALHEELKFHSGMFTRMYGNEPEVATIKGGKTGYTVNSGNCLVSYALTDDGREIICVTAKGGGKYIPIYDCIELYKEYTH